MQEMTDEQFDRAQERISELECDLSMAQHALNQGMRELYHESLRRAFLAESRFVRLEYGIEGGNASVVAVIEEPEDDGAWTRVSFHGGEVSEGWCAQHGSDLAKSCTALYESMEKDGSLERLTDLLIAGGWHEIHEEQLLQVFGSEYDGCSDFIKEEFNVDRDKFLAGEIEIGKLCSWEYFTSGKNR